MLKILLLLTGRLVSITIFSLFSRTDKHDDNLTVEKIWDLEKKYRMI